MLHLVKNSARLMWDYIRVAGPEEILAGRRIFRPFMKSQQSWMAFCYPGQHLSTDTCVWSYLQKFMMPLIKKHASFYHLNGIQQLKLDVDEQPDFKEFQKRFANVADGFQIQPVKGEIAPREYFELISQKKFPCIEKMRSHAELFCANEPDFWHEAIGHLAPLCSRDVQELYLEVAHHMLASKTTTQFNNNLAVAWTLMEYGFIKQQAENKMFGAALVGSHLANIRYLRNNINVEPADRNAIIDSGFFDENTSLARNDDGKLRFFCLDISDVDRLFFNSMSLL